MEAKVTVVIPHDAGPAALALTLAALARHTPEPHQLVLLVSSNWDDRLPASPNEPWRPMVVPNPGALPVTLNQLSKVETAPYILLLESGAVVTAGWLSRLLAPLDDPAIGLSGPSTNVAWNEQQVMGRAAGYDWSTEQIDASGQRLASEHGERCVPLVPLHSLGEFCYLFKRSVAERLGGFDEAYADGPCWEMDFNVRAARAGFAGVWVPAAYVHRGPPPRVKADAHRRLFAQNKRLYQDRFCGLRLCGAVHEYDSHCRGEACEHFAPRELIQVTLGRSAAANSEPIVVSAVPFEPVQGEPLPLVSCIMVTRNRRPFVRQAIAYFERQDYANRELIIVDDGDDLIGDLVPADPRVRYTALLRPLSIGAKRNLACESARGEIIAQWDDDDWYGPQRLRRQIAPLLAGEADITGLEGACFFMTQDGLAWTCTPELHRRLFVGNVHGGTLVYRRSVWEQLARYPDRSLAEDALFLRQACGQGARLVKLPAQGIYVYIRHDRNAWRLVPGSYLDPSGWKREDPNVFLPAADSAFYAELSTGVHPGKGEALRTATQAGPLVSCIMPTYNRRAFVPQAVRYFLRQDYADRELLILDDGEDSIADLVPADPRVRYVRLDAKRVLGAKRNLACELARGSIIAHWDDDDWSAPHRLSYQVGILLSHKADVCGAGQELYYDPTTEQGWRYEYPPTRRRWLAGNSLCYLKAFWERNRFPEIAVGEDTRFIWSSHTPNLQLAPDHSFLVGIIHPSNTSRKQVTGAYWHPYPVAQIHHVLGSDRAFYKLLANGAAAITGSPST